MEGLFDMLANGFSANQIPDSTNFQPPTGTGPQDLMSLIANMPFMNGNGSYPNGTPSFNDSTAPIPPQQVGDATGNIKSDGTAVTPGTSAMPPELAAEMKPQAAPVANKRRLNDHIAFRTDTHGLLPTWAGDLATEGENAPVRGEYYADLSRGSIPMNMGDGGASVPSANFSGITTADPNKKVDSAIMRGEKSMNIYGDTPQQLADGSGAEEGTGEGAPQQLRSMFPYMTGGNSPTGGWREMARMSQEGQNKYPTVFAEAGKLLGMNPVQIRDTFYPKDLQNIPKDTSQVANSLYDMLVKQYGGTPRGPATKPDPIPMQTGKA